MTHSLDLVYSTAKGYASLLPLYNFLHDQDWDVRFNKIHRNCFRNRKVLKQISSTLVIAYDKPLVRLERCGWRGEFIYIEHGLSPVKYYTYKYDFFQRATLLFYPGEIFKRKMEAINPEFQKGLLGGYPRIDELVTMTIDKVALCKRFGLQADKPIILFAPSWGGKHNPDAGIHNAKHLAGMENVLIIPHSADYGLVKKYGAVRPGDGNINQFLHLADVVVSDVSSVLAEASILNKPVVQLELPHYPGCFPEPEKRRSGVWVSQTILDLEQQTDRSQRPFKIPYVDEDWIMGHTTRPDQLRQTIELALREPDRFQEQRQYWAEQSCWSRKGQTCLNLSRMMDTFLSQNILKQEIV